MREFQDLNQPVNERIARQVKAGDNRRSKTVGCWIALVALQTASGTAGAHREPRKLENVTKQAFDRYVGLTQERNDAELERGSHLCG